MATRTLEGATPRLGGQRRGTRVRSTLPLRHRIRIIIALILLATTASYSTVALFARVYPALFPGQTLAGTISVASVVAPLPGLGGVKKLNEVSSFNDRINLLVIGVDKRPQYADFNEYRTDMVMVASLDPIQQRVNILSFPRDMWINIYYGEGPRDYYQDRLNASYGVGFRAGNGYDSGAKQVAQALHDNFGIDVDNWVLLDFKGVEKLIDAVGGVDVDIPYELSAPPWWYSDNDLAVFLMSFPSGQQHLSGYQAVAFGRYRGDNDLFRVKRQQLVLQAALQKLFNLGLLNNPIDLWDAYSTTVKTDISKARMLGLVPLFKQTQGRTGLFSLGDPVDGNPTVRSHTTAGGASVLLWDPDNVRYWLDQAFPKVKYVGSVVEIQDGFGSDGGARASALARYLLFYRNLPVVSFGPDPGLRTRTSVTLYGDREALALDVAKWLTIPPEAIRREQRPEGSTLPDVVIVIGEDFKIPGP